MEYIGKDVSYFPSIFETQWHPRFLHVRVRRAFRPVFSRSAQLSLSRSATREETKGRKTRARCAPTTQKLRGASTRTVMSSLHPFALFHPFRDSRDCFNTALSAAAPRKPSSSTAFTRIGSTWLFVYVVGVLLCVARFRVRSDSFENERECY